MLTIPITIISMVYMVLLTIAYFSKKRISTYENKIYSNMIKLSCVGIIIDAISTTFVLFNTTDSYLFVVVTKMMFVYYVMWSGLLLSYTAVVSIKSKNVDRMLNKIYAFFVGCSILVIFLPLVYNKTEAGISPEGLSVSFTYFIAGFFSIAVMLGLLTANYKHIKSKKYIPIYLLLILFFLSILIQQWNPELILTTAIECFITFLMYFTVENPDVQMLEELLKNKKVIERSNENTSNFLFKMTQDIKKPVKDIITISNDMFNIDDKEDLKEGTKIINNKAKELDYLINESLDVSMMSTKAIKVYDSRYNVSNLFEEVKHQLENRLDQKVKLEYSISNNLPHYVYGDSLKLKQALYSILENSIKKTKHGYIGLSVDSIVKYDICRLIVSISDTGAGMNIEDVNEILSLKFEDLDNIKLDEKKKILNLRETKKLINLIGGELMVKSEEGKGTTVVITIDQKIVETKETEISKKLELYEESLNSNKRIMVVDDDAKELSKIVNILENEEKIVSSSLFGRDVIEKISNRHSFDLIILDDETDTISAYEVLKELKKNKKFNTPVVIMIEDNKEFIKLHYLKDGFADCILKSKLESELKRILKRF